jgi:hypothetical protein
MHDDDEMDRLLTSALRMRVPELSPGLDAAVMLRERPGRLEGGRVDDLGHQAGRHLQLRGDHVLVARRDARRPPRMRTERFAEGLPDHPVDNRRTHRTRCW